VQQHLISLRAEAVVQHTVTVIAPDIGYWVMTNVEGGGVTGVYGCLNIKEIIYVADYPAKVGTISPGAAVIGRYSSLAH
jgi:hypothetical protein